MDRNAKGLFRQVLGATAACICLSAAGAELPMGRYAGTLVAANGDEGAVELSFDNMAGRPLATMSTSTPDSRLVGLSNIVVSNDALAFSYFLDGSSVQCELARQDDGGFAGPCADGDGPVGSIRVTPQQERGHPPGPAIAAAHWFRLRRGTPTACRGSACRAAYR